MLLMASTDGGYVATYVVVLLALYIFTCVGLMGVFIKARQEPAWAAFVPFWNVWLEIKLTGRPPWFMAVFVVGFFLDLFIPIVGIVIIVFEVLLLNSLSRSFGKSPWFTVGLVFLFPIFIWILWKGSAVYLGPSAGPGAIGGPGGGFGQGGGYGYGQGGWPGAGPPQGYPPQGYPPPTYPPPSYPPPQPGQPPPAPGQGPPPYPGQEQPPPGTPPP